MCAGRAVSIEPRVFDVVVYLIEQRHRAVGRDELIAAAWGRADCSDATLAQAILKARRLFGDSGDAQRTIRTAPRFGYQWVAATHVVVPDADAAAAVESLPTMAPPAHEAVPLTAQWPATLPFHARPRRASPWWWSIAAACLVLIAIGTFWTAQRQPSAAQRMRPVRGLVLVAPANVHSALAQDGWMRLGLMAMSADALRTLPGRSLVPNETVLVASRGDGTVSPARLRELTGATTIVTIDARHSEKGWALDASLLAADASEQVVSAEDGDAVTAAAALADRLRTALGGNGRGESEVAPHTLALAARMQAAILEGHAERALALAAGADPAALPAEVTLLRAAAMNRLGQADAAVATMHELIERAGRTTPGWLAAAWKTLGYGELLRGHTPAAEQAFVQAIATAGNDRSEAARGWRGLGNAQAMQGAYAQAEASCLRARLELGEDGDRLLLAHIEDDLGSVAGHRGRYDEAIAHYRRAVATAAAIGAAELEIGSRMNIALAQTEQLHHVEALASWRDL
ncbi:MAG: winged helix-turn-helix domain-containing protein, partial [Dokdonella sp.]